MAKSNIFEKLTNPSMEDWFDIWTEEPLIAGFIHKVNKNLDAVELYPKEEVNTTIEKVLYKGTKRERTEKRTKTKELFSSITYRPDREIIWNAKAKDIFFTDAKEVDWFNLRTFFVGYKLPDGRYSSTIDVKAPATFKGNASDTSFSIKRRIIYSRWRLYINKCMIMPARKFKNNSALKKYLFSATFTPARFFMTDKLTKRRSISYWEPRTFNEFISTKNRVK